MSIQFNNITEFAATFNRFYPGLVNYIEQYIGQKEAAKDLAQDVFIKLYESPSTFPSLSSLKAWLFLCARNASIDHLRSQRVKASHNRQLIESLLFISQSDSTFDDETIIKVNQAINRLPQHCRIIIKMNIIENKKYREIANELNISINTVHTQVNRGYNKLRIYLNHIHTSS